MSFYAFHVQISGQPRIDRDNQRFLNLARSINPVEADIRNAGAYFCRRADGSYKLDEFITVGRARRFLYYATRAGCWNFYQYNDI